MLRACLSCFRALLGSSRVPASTQRIVADRLALRFHSWPAGPLHQPNIQCLATMGKRGGKPAAEGPRSTRRRLLQALTTTGPPDGSDVAATVPEPPQLPATADVTVTAVTSSPVPATAAGPLLHLTAAESAIPPTTTATAEAPGPGAQAKPTKSKKKLTKLPPPSVDPENVDLKAKALRLVQQLEELYPNPPIPLNHQSTFQLLVAVVLSAQTTDLKVNECTPSLFGKWPDAHAMSQAEVTAVAHEVRFLGLGPTKAKNIVALSQILVAEHGGEVPGSWESLEALPGVGHKTASVVMSQAFGQPAFPVDTHIHRLAQRWGLTNGPSVEQTESDLKALFPPDTWRNAHLQIIYFGREHCPAQGHDPAHCPICSWAAVHPYNRLGASPPRPGQKPGGKGKRSAAVDSSESESESEDPAGTENDDSGTKKSNARRPRKKTVPPPGDGSDPGGVAPRRVRRARA